LQTINISLRTLYRPRAEFLPKIYSNLGLDYEERVLPSIINEVLKAIVVSIHIYEKVNMNDNIIHFIF
jgi:prohibitin 1